MLIVVDARELCSLCICASVTEGSSPGLITRGIVTFNFSPRNLTQVTSTMKPGQDSMFGFFFGKENNSSRRVILKIELELNDLNSILSRSAVTPVFPNSRVQQSGGHCKYKPGFNCEETRRAGQEARLNYMTTRQSKQDAHRNSSQDLKGDLVVVFFWRFSPIPCFLRLAHFCSLSDIVCEYFERSRLSGCPARYSHTPSDSSIPCSQKTR